MELNHRVFISYKSEFENIVAALTNYLEKDGIPCWYAPRNLDNGTAGADYDDSIVAAINATDVVVVVLCDESLKSNWVKREVTHAEDKGKTIIPFVISDLTVDNGLRMRLKDKHWIYGNPDPEKKFELLEHNILVSIGQASPAISGSAPASRSVSEDFQQYDPNHDLQLEEGIAYYEAKEYVTALTPLLSAAKHGNQKAKDLLCSIFYQMKKQISKIPEELWDEIQVLADQNHSFANFILSIRYFNSSNLCLSFDYLKKSVFKKEYPLAVLQMGIHYCWGIGTSQNHVLSQHYYQKAIDLGCVEAYSYMGQMYEFGQTKSGKDESMAEKYYKAGAEKWDVRALSRLISLYIYSDERKSLSQAMVWAQKMIDHDIADGYELMGNIYLAKNDWYIDEDNPDFKKCLKYYKEATQRDVVIAYADLANVYWCKGDHENAYRYAKIGARSHDSFALKLLAYFYQEDEKYEEAWKYAMANYIFNSANVAMLAELYLTNGYRPEGYDIHDLISILEIAARNTGEEELDYLIMIYTDEKYGMKDPDKAREWIKFGASKKMPKPLLEYGKMLMDPENPDFNQFKGIGLIEESVLLGNKDAFSELAVLLHQEDNHNDSRLQQLYLQCFKQDVFLEEYAKELIEAGLAAESREEQKWVNNNIYPFLSKVPDHGQQQKILAKILQHHFSEGSILNQETIERLTKKARYFIEDRHYAQSLLPVLQNVCPELDLVDALRRGDQTRLDDLYYFIFQAEEEEKTATSQYERTLKKIVHPFYNDVSFKQIQASYALPYLIPGTARSYNTVHVSYMKAYLEVCSKYHVNPRTIDLPDTHDVYPIFKTQTFHKLKKQVIAAFLDFFQTNSKDMQKIKEITVGLCKPDGQSRLSDLNEKYLDVAQASKDDAMSEFIVSFVECMLDLDIVIYDKFCLVKNYLNGKEDSVRDTLKSYLSRMKEYDVHTDLTEEFFDRYPCKQS